MPRSGHPGDSPPGEGMFSKGLKPERIRGGRGRAAFTTARSLTSPDVLRGSSSEVIHWRPAEPLMKAPKMLHRLAVGAAVAQLTSRDRSSPRRGGGC